ncbi:g6436 [Coccomyxa viridis]|uniref:G6436 protein n=1 Tax=Coccomyxa viridis TaxID=1274662 RepID=A0ABP1FVD5_9CHLO
MELRTSDDTLLSMLEYGADPKEMEHPGMVDDYASRRSTEDTSSLVSALSRQPGHTSAAAQPLEYAAQSAQKERRLPDMASPARNLGLRGEQALQRSRRQVAGASPSNPSAAQHPPGDRADRGMLGLMAVQPKQFPCSLDPSPASSSDASAEANSRQLGLAQSRVPARPSLSSEGRGAQLVRVPSNGSRSGLTSAPSRAVDAGAVQAQARMKNRLIADLRSQKQQLTEELESALMENQQLKQRVQQDERLKAQHDGLLERLRGARAELDQALAQRQQADLAMGSLQQRVRAMAAKQAVSRETEHKMASRMLEKNKMLDQLYETLKELKQQYEAGREEAAMAATGLEEAQHQLAQHAAAAEDARKLQADASASLVSLGLRCEGLAETLAAERSSRQATEATLHSKEQDLQTVEADLQKAQQELLGKERQLSNLAADLNGARQRAEGLEQELHSAWDAAQAQRQRMAALQEDLQSAWADAHEQRRAAAALVQEADGLRAKFAEIPESEDELEGSDLDVALPAFMGESRAQLIRSREFAHGQLTAEMEAEVESTVPTEDGRHSEGQHPMVDVDHSPCDSQDGVVHSAKEAFEAMSASGGWSVYTNKVARRISDGGTSSKLAHEMSL